MLNLFYLAAVLTLPPPPPPPIDTSISICIGIAIDSIIAHQQQLHKSTHCYFIISISYNTAKFVTFMLPNHLLISCLDFARHVGYVEYSNVPVHGQTSSRVSECKQGKPKWRKPKGRKSVQHKIVIIYSRAIIYRIRNGW